VLSGGTRSAAESTGVLQGTPCQTGTSPQGSKGCCARVRLGLGLPAGECQRLLGGGCCLSGSWASEFNNQGKQETVYSAGLLRAALAPWGWLLLFLPATGESLILFCTSTDRQERD